MNIIISNHTLRKNTRVKFLPYFYFIDDLLNTVYDFVMTEQDKLKMQNTTLVDAELIESVLFERHGPLLADDALRIALGYKSTEAFRQALSRKTVPVPVFSVENRRGKYALVKDVASWLAQQRNAALNDFK